MQSSAAPAPAARPVTPAVPQDGSRADASPAPELVLTADDTEVTRSCTLVVPPGTILVDDEGDGVLQVRADGVEITFAPGSVLRGAPADTPLDGLAGVGIAITGAKGVVVRGAVVHGFKIGIDAIEADGLLVDGCDVSDNFAQRLRSTPQAADDGADWLEPHDNDAREWTTRYGAGIALLRTDDATVRGCRARRTQNGLVLDRVTGSRVYDDDFSFLSGWGVALWRSSENVITRNALDFCVRGYSHGVYNRGQDSAGLLMFEQCLHNVVAENSITHGGDGVFAFAGREALGETAHGARRAPDAPCGDDGNLFVGNDLSSAAAHGLELTFSRGNVIRENRFAENAICGIWGGYSRDTLIEKNLFTGNGEAGYGKERGGVNVEHGARNLIRDNAFSGNRCGVHLWWDDDAQIAKLPWAAVFGTDAEDNAVVGNRFGGDTTAIELRATTRTLVTGNRFDDVGEELVVEGEAPRREGVPVVPATTAPDLVVLGQTRPVGARAPLAGRASIVMTGWGPWDHASPLLRRVSGAPGLHTWELLSAPDDARVTLDGDGLRLRRDGTRIEVALDVDRHGVFEYTLRVEGSTPPLAGSGRLVRIPWTVSVFPCDDPRDDPAVFDAAAASPAAVTRTLDALQLRYAGGGPSDLPAFADAVPRLPSDHFGTRAEASVPLGAGRWRLEVESDDGVRVTVDGEVVLDDWTWHAPRKASVEIDLDAPRDVHVLVEHFELDGYAVLALDWLRVP
ncbi:MAG: right-handed parallel beta-helix repeat-containing protein [Planctomycetes bacterium]|nr:right-handed parallel beta-helix repeat-containing protein [Planctomycetota bacterium]